MDSLKPLKLQKWDGHISQYRSGWLHARCPCASCQEEANKPVAQPTGLNLLPVFDPSSEQLASLTPTGQYGYSIAFKDGHATGIFAFEYLRSICECDECRLKIQRGIHRSDIQQHCASCEPENLQVAILALTEGDGGHRQRVTDPGERRHYAPAEGNRGCGLAGPRHSARGSSEPAIKGHDDGQRHNQKHQHLKLRTVHQLPPDHRRRRGPCRRDLQEAVRVEFGVPCLVDLPSSRQESPTATGRCSSSPFAACFRGGATISRPYSR